MNKTYYKFIAVFTVLLLAGLNVSYAKRVQGVTEDSIHVGYIGDLSGPIAFYGKELLEGMELQFNEINANGGVYGRKIILHHEDDSYQPPRSVAAFRKLLDRDRVFCFAGNLGSATVMATLPFVKRAKVPLIVPGNFNSKMYRPMNPYVFAMSPSYYDQSRIMVKYIVDSHGKQASRIAVIYQDDDMGMDGLDGLREAVKEFGGTLVAEESYKRGAIDFSSQILNLRGKNPTHVILWTVYREAAAILKKAKQSKLEAVFIGGSPVGDPKVIELAGQDSEGLLVVSTVDLWSKQPNEHVRMFKALLKKKSPDRQPTPIFAFGHSIGQVLVAGLERAGPDLDREKLIQALETLKSFETVTSIFTYGPGVRGGVDSKAFILKANPAENSFIRISDWITVE